MSLTSLPIPPIPEEIVRVAHTVFPRGNVIMQMRDTLGTIYTDEACADLFPSHGQPAFAPWRLALVTVFQFMEGLTDRQTADAVRDRLAWTSTILVLTTPFSPSAAHARSREMLSNVCSISCWSDVGRVDSEKRPDGTAPTRPMCLRRSAFSIGTDGWMLLDALQAPPAGFRAT